MVMGMPHAETSCLLSCSERVRRDPGTNGRSRVCRCHRSIEGALGNPSFIRPSCQEWYFSRLRQLGPDTRRPDSRANSPNCFCRFPRSSIPRSAKPAEMTMAEPAPRWWLCWSTSSNPVVGHHHADRVRGLGQVGDAGVTLGVHDFVVPWVGWVHFYTVVSFQRRSQHSPTKL